METVKVKDRLQSLYKTGQDLMYEAKIQKREDGDADDDDDRLKAATMIHRIASVSNVQGKGQVRQLKPFVLHKEYRKIPERRSPPKIKVDWLDVQQEASEAPLSLPNDIEKHEKHRESISALPEGPKKKQRTSFSDGPRTVKEVVKQN